jgi:hypothetical protein
VLDRHSPALQLPKPRNQKQLASHFECFTAGTGRFLDPPRLRHRTRVRLCNQTNDCRRVCAKATQPALQSSPRQPGFRFGLPRDGPRFCSPAFRPVCLSRGRRGAGLSRKFLLLPTGDCFFHRETGNRSELTCRCPEGHLEEFDVLTSFFLLNTYVSSG